jgi:preprotein translocase subunit SecY
LSSQSNPLNITQAWNIPDIQRRLKFVAFALLIFVLGTHIPTPGISQTLISNFFGAAGGSEGGLLGLLDLFTGGALSKFSVFALGVMPYINASILMQILVAIEPRLKEIQKEGESGRKLISKYTRYLAIFFAFLQGIGLIYSFQGGNALSPDYAGIMRGVAPLTALLVVVAGTCFLMWLGDEITNRGIGNGMSVIIFIGIVNRVPWQIAAEMRQAQFDQTRWMAILLFALFLVAIVAAIVFIQLSVRKIPVQYARRQVGRKIYGGQSTFLPMKIAMAGVIPIIFAVSLLMIPPTILQFMPQWSAGQSVWGRFNSSPWYAALEFTLVVLFTFIYTAITFNTKEIADNLKKQGGFIPGIRPGKPTFDFLDKVLHRITVFGGIFLGLIAIIPIIVNDLVFIATQVKIQTFYIGGTSLLIVVGVALDTVQQLQAHMVMRHYSGFTK